MGIPCGLTPYEKRWNVSEKTSDAKARLVAGGHTIAVPATITYSSVVSREKVRIALLLASLYDVEVKTADIYAYITTPCSEKIWTV